ncbi:MAG: EAL domain-containing protein [Actinomycetota bacterium]|nr:EAL domain-containing protein [Actinomycetota bacterium]
MSDRVPVGGGSIRSSTRRWSGGWFAESHWPTLLLTVTMVVVAGALWELPLLHKPMLTVPGPHLRWWMLMPAFVVSETFVLHVQVKREARTISLSDLPLVLGLFFAAPGALLAARLVGSVAVYVLWRRQHPLKAAFNAGQLFVEVTVAVLAFRLMRGVPDLSLRSAVAALLATSLAGAVTATLVIVVIALNEGLNRLRELGVGIRSGVAIASGVTTIALLGVAALAFDVRSGVLLVAMVGLLMYAYREYASLSRRHLSLERLFQFTQVVSSSPEMDEVLSSLLHQARELLRSEYAEVVVWTSSHRGRAGETGVRVALDGTSGMTRSPVTDADGDARVLERVLSTGDPLLGRRGSREAIERDWLVARGFREAVAAPLRGDAGVTGMLAVANRLGDVRTFDLDDIQLLQTVANHASVALENGRLVEQLRHDALHDALTGLPNRVLLQRRLVARLDALVSQAEDGFGVMIMDLDGFKEVNDTLGHQQGDLLLREVGRRLAEAIRPGDTVARLGGDEFALLISDIGDPLVAVGTGLRLLQALDDPMLIDGTEVQVRASLGVSLVPGHGNDATALLKQADMAMYSAKQGGTGVVVYQPSIDTSSPERLALVGQLRAALASSDQIVVHLQPQAAASTGEITGFEALVRWQHPTRGLIYPDSFVPLAERCGLIRPLTSAVLRSAVTAATQWQRPGRPLSVAVNVSPRCILNDDLVGEVASLLSSTGLSAEQLTLEITESSVMSDPGRTIAILAALAELGVRLSVDDFGTGYSSLAYLQRLPVDEIKIDKSFVIDMNTSEGDHAIVRSIVDLGANLHLDVVAEGVETDQAWAALREMGCKSVQGYRLARPMPAEEIPGWLAAYRPPYVGDDGGDRGTVLPLQRPAATVLPFQLGR